MVLADSYPFFGVLWSMLVFFLWVAWFMMLFHVIGDVFRRRDASGWNKTAWLIFVICAPFLGVFVYLIVNGSEMAQRECPAERALRRRGLQLLPDARGRPWHVGRDRACEGPARQRSDHRARVPADQGARHRLSHPRATPSAPGNGPTRDCRRRATRSAHRSDRARSRARWPHSGCTPRACGTPRSPGS